MKKPVKHDETRAVPKLSGETKAMNGKSSSRLMQCIDDLNAALGGSRERALDDDTPREDRGSDERRND